MNGSDSKYVLITGTSTGIGRACALRLAKEGFTVFAGVRKDGDAPWATGIHPIKIDVTHSASIHTAAMHIRKAVGHDGLFGLVNNAGICVVGPAECISLQDWRKQFEVNLFGAIAVTQAMLPLMRQRVATRAVSKPRIVNIGSVTGEISTPLFGAYSASKFALGAFSDALRLELRASRIAVSTIIPGTIQSEIWRKEKQGVEQIRPHPIARECYSSMIDSVSKYVFHCADKAIPADHVARLVQRCLTCKSPRSRYRVGWEAKIGSMARKVLPGDLLGFLVGKTLGVPDSLR